MNDLISALAYRQSLSGLMHRAFVARQSMTPEEWAEEVYRLPTGGRFKWSYAPYSREMFRSLFERATIETIFQLFSRGLKSTVVLLALGYRIDRLPCRILSLWPTNLQAEKWSKDCLTGELFDCTPPLHYLGSENAKRNGKNTLLHKNFNGGLIDLFGANAPGDMRRAKGEFLYAEEIDAISQEMGDEGDQMAVFYKRGDEYPDATRVCASYPSMKGKSKIEARMQDSDYRQWKSTCLKCGREPFVMHRSQVIFDNERPQDAKLQCPRCKEFLNDDQRYSMAHEQGFNNWFPTREFKGKRGFQANAMLWPHPVDRVKYPGGFLQLMAQQAIDAEKSDNPERSRRVLVNTVDAETFVADTKDEIPPDWMHLLKCRESYADKTILLPRTVLYMTAGIDVQEDRIEVTKLGWGEHEELWTIEHVVIPSGTKHDVTWDALELELLRTYNREKLAEGNGTQTKLELGFSLVDASFSPERVLRWIGRLHTKESKLLGRVRACRGSSNYPHPIIEFKYSKLSKQLKGHWVGTDESKDLIYSRLRMTEPGPGYMHHGLNFTEKHIKQLVAEKMTIGFKDGQETRRFKNDDHVRNETLDCRVYGLAAYRLKRPNLEEIERAFNEQEEKKEEEKPKLALPLIPVRQNSFVGAGQWRIQ